MEVFPGGSGCQSCTPQRSACVVMQRVATRRSKQTWQHKPHVTNTNPATNKPVRHWRAPTDRGGQRAQNRTERATCGCSLFLCTFPVSSPSLYFPPPSSPVCLSSVQVWHMPYSSSLNLFAASPMCCHREKKKRKLGASFFFWGGLKMCFNLVLILL